MADGTVMFKIDSCIHGYHAYGTIWTHNLSEHISCEWEIANAEGHYTEAVMLISMFVVQLLRVLPVCAAFPRLLYISRHPFWVEIKSSTGTYLRSAIHIDSRVYRNSI